jgi:ribosomal protein L13E
LPETGLITLVRWEYLRKKEEESMSPITVIILIIVALVVIAAIVYGVQASRRKQLQNTFGPEYDRVVADTGSRSDAEKELRERTKRHAELELKPLSAESKATYSAAWEEVQIQFVDRPEEAVSTADDLVTRLIAERGYPTGDYDERLANLSVDHARTLGHYRDAHAISQRSAKGEASTEDLRQALVHYRALFADLLGTDPLKTSPNATADAVTADSADAAETPAPAPSADPRHDTDAAGSRPDTSRN